MIPGSVKMRKAEKQVMLLYFLSLLLMLIEHLKKDKSKRSVVVGFYLMI
jgi:hypothetical protein